MANSDSGKHATDQAHESYSDDNKARRVIDVNSPIDMSSGSVPGISSVHKFGETPDFDIGDGKVSIWDCADDGNLNQMVYVYSTGADIDSLSSSNAADTQEVEVQGLDVNKNLVVQTITLSGTTPVSLNTDLCRVFRMKNSGTFDFSGMVYCYEGPAQTNGVPTNSGSVRAIVNNGNNQTLMAIYTIPNGKTGYLRSFFAATAGANKVTNYIIDVVARSDGGVFQLQHRTALSEVGTSHFQHNNTIPEKFNAKTDIEMRTEITDGTITGAAVSAGFELTLVDD